MQARTFYALVVSSLAAASGGCCCCDPCGGCCWPQPIVWTGECHECGPDACTSCADCCGECGILPALRRKMTCNKGCGEIYIGEWISDPPDCCDPCDQCYGCWTGPQGACCLGPFQRLLAACHGYSYCPKPCCGPACGGFCNRGACGAACGCAGVGCATCGGGAHGVVLSSGAAPFVPGHSIDVLPSPADPHHSILNENWNIPKSKPIPGKPIHKAQQPPRAQMSSRQRPQAIGAGVRQANYDR